MEKNTIFKIKDGNDNELVTITINQQEDGNCEIASVLNDEALQTLLTDENEKRLIEYKEKFTNVKQWLVKYKKGWQGILRERFADAVIRYVRLDCKLFTDGFLNTKAYEEVY